MDFCHVHDIGHQPKNGQATLESGTNSDGKPTYDSTDLSMVLTTTDKGVSHKAVVLLDKPSDEQSSTSEYVAANYTESGAMVITDCSNSKENHSNASQIARVALMNGQKYHPVCDTSLGNIGILRNVFGS